ncbi:DUF459 domain-containing protein [Helicobacter sp. MIT 21-1697]|uniref:SGNH/GDSL hydrolase family protein n=1 Tax=Helicobacter sp. MIT 21-1697 TaxID=2993733 RepID=UPI00224A83DA|nr:DUF459 domain-containing protein [Helicobacter sp. MIT 21-1697]MCX2717719.1 DUF459 domain-containing protein [Helicobacter sp. MIT 21-1697]
MKETKFVFIAFATLVQLFITLHSSIILYVEQQYHNFTESPYPFVQVLSGFYERIMLRNNALFAYADNLTQSLEQVRKEIFTFDNLAFTQEKKPEQDKRNAPAKKDSKKSKKPKHNTNNVSYPKPKTPPLSHTPLPINENPPSQTSQDLSANPPVPKDNEHSSKDSETIQTPTLTDEPVPITPPPVNQSAQTAQPIPPPVKKPSIKEQSPKVQESYMPLRPIHNPRIPIDEGSSVLLIGDSMMQGIAPYVLKTFKKVHLHGINLSKHSTGLTYKHYFNWEAALRAAFEKNPDIALVVVILGANDPWSMKNNIAFKSARWEETYIQRIEEIVNVAHSYGARVAWYEVPLVSAKSLNDKVVYLNGLYERVVKEGGEYFLQSNGIVTQEGKYSAFIKDANGKSVQVRIDDGVHFTARGYQIMANIFLNALEIIPQIKEQDMQEDLHDSLPAQEHHIKEEHWWDKG